MLTEKFNREEHTKRKPDKRSKENEKEEVRTRK